MARRSNRDPPSRWKCFFFTDSPLVFIRAGSPSSSSTDGFVTVVASAFAFALASGATGSLGGFIFGVPRPQAGGRTETDAGGLPADGNTKIIPNTNIEHISDWLTKVIIGATLVQLTNIPSAAARLFAAMAPALGGGDSGAAFAGGIVIYFAVTALLLEWL
jgi:hypothetical protein